MCILEKVRESLLRYGNPDMLILGTLKIKLQISSSWSSKMKNLILLFYQGSFSSLILPNYHKYVTPEHFNFCFTSKISQNWYFINNFLIKSSRNKYDFVYTKVIFTNVMVSWKSPSYIKNLLCLWMTYKENCWWKISFRKILM